MTPSPDLTETVEVLIAEDDAGLRRLLEMLLACNGFRVRSAEDGVDALAAYDASPPDVIVTDVMMPRMSGLTLCRELRRGSGRAATTPIILLTARMFDEDIEEVMQLGGISFMNKPFDHLQLSSAIHAACRPQAESDETVPGSDRLGWLHRPTVPAPPGAEGLLRGDRVE